MHNFLKCSFLYFGVQQGYSTDQFYSITLVHFRIFSLIRKPIDKIENLNFISIKNVCLYIFLQVLFSILGQIIQLNEIMLFLMPFLCLYSISFFLKLDLATLSFNNQLNFSRFSISNKCIQESRKQPPKVVIIILKQYLRLVLSVHQNVGFPLLVGVSVSCSPVKCQ